MKRIALLVITLIFITACATTKTATAPQVTAPAAEQQQGDTTWKQKADNVGDSIGSGVKKGYTWIKDKATDPNFLQGFIEGFFNAADWWK